MDIKVKEKLKKIKYVVMDLDGSLLNSERHISKLTIQTILKAQLAGYKFVIASGRISTMIDAYVKTLGLDSYVISSNGAIITDLKKQKVVYKQHVTYDDTVNLVNFCIYNSIECSILTNKACYFMKDSVRMQRFVEYNEIAKINHVKPLKIKIYHQLNNSMNHVEKLLIRCEDDKKDLLLNYIKKNTSIQVTTSDHYIYDCSAHDVSKGTALSWLLDKHKINHEEVLVFGDFDNDVSMFKVAGVAVAMGNATHNAKEHADYVTKTNDEDGIAFVINEMLEEGKE